LSKTFIARITAQDEHLRYLEACARIRGISVQALVRSVIGVVTRDQLVVGILDDDGKHVRRPEDNNLNRGNVPVDNLFDAVHSIKDTTDLPLVSKLREKAKREHVKSPSIVMRAPNAPQRKRAPNSLTFRRSKDNKSSAQLRAELEEAVRNTAAMSVE